MFQHCVVRTHVARARGLFGAFRSPWGSRAMVALAERAAVGGRSKQVGRVRRGAEEIF